MKSMDPFLLYLWWLLLNSFPLILWEGNLQHILLSLRCEKSDYVTNWVNVLWEEEWLRRVMSVLVIVNV